MRGEWKVVKREPVLGSATIHEMARRKGYYAVMRWRAFETRTNSNGKKFHRIREETGPHTLDTYSHEGWKFESAMKAIHTLMRDIEKTLISCNEIDYNEIDNQPSGRCCANEDRNMNGWCKNCGDPCI